MNYFHTFYKLCRLIAEKPRDHNLLLTLASITQQFLFFSPFPQHPCGTTTCISPAALSRQIKHTVASKTGPLLLSASHLSTQHHTTLEKGTTAWSAYGLLPHFHYSLLHSSPLTSLWSASKRYIHPSACRATAAAQVAVSPRRPRSEGTR